MLTIPLLTTLLPYAVAAPVRAGDAIGWTGFGLSLAGAGWTTAGVAIIADSKRHGGGGRALAGAFIGTLVFVLPGSLATEIGTPLLLSGATSARDPWQPAWPSALGWSFYGLHLGLGGASLYGSGADWEEPQLRLLTAGTMACWGLAMTFGAVQLAQNAQQPAPTSLPPILVPIASGRW